MLLLYDFAGKLKNMEVEYEYDQNNNNIYGLKDVNDTTYF